MKRIDLLSKSLPRRSWPGPARQVKRFLGEFPEAGLILGIAGILVLWSLMGAVNVQWARQGVVNQRKKLSAMKLQVSHSKTEEPQRAKERASLKRQQDELQKKLQAIEESQQPRVPLSTILAQLGAALPEDLEISKLTLEGKALKLIGGTSRAQSVSELMAGLDHSRYFRDSTFGYTQRSEDTAQSLFTFEVKTWPLFEENGIPPSSLKNA